MQRTTRRLAGLSLLGLVWLLSSQTVFAEVDYLRDVQPILAEHCWHCHGTDADDRKAGLRLDQSEGSLKGGESGSAAIVPGHPDESELIKRLITDDENLVMPPPSQKKPVSATHLATLKQWIAEGAKFEAHWAFTPPVKATLPQAGTTNPIDAFVLDRLKRENLTPSPKASNHTLCRRLYLDLIGLPPSPQELADFEKDGYDATVKKLMASERYGEKWARNWLDLARYSDTNGYEKDLKREQWAWRDWVIDTINKDMPYDQFIIEQIAGDLLPNATQSQMIATGFLRNSMINEEGAIVAEQFRMVEMFDRIDCVGKAVLGLSTQCAQCHTHKFDPITHDEYYGMFSYLNNSYEAMSWVYTPEQLKQIDEIKQKLAAIEERVRTAHPQWAAELAAWEADLTAKRIAWTPLDAIEMGSISGLTHPTQDADKRLLMQGHTSADVFFIASPPLKGVTGLQLEALPHRDFPQNGPGRTRQGTWTLHELEVFIKKPDSKDWEKQKLVNATADFSEPDSKSADGKKATGPVSYLIDGSDDNSWKADRGTGRRNQAGVAVVQFETPLEFPEGTQMKVAWRNSDMLGCARFSTTTQPTPTSPLVDQAAVLAMATPADQRTAEQKQAIFTAWRNSVADLKGLNDEINALVKTQPEAETTVLHIVEREPSNHRDTHLLSRGNWEQPLQVIPPHVPAALHAFPENAPNNRLGFAMWLADKRSPLTARVEVNQLWQSIFGMGLVETAEDFGTRAPIPEYRELLDWLAVDFMEHNWSRKHVIQTIMSSATYQQSSQARKELLERDPNNHLLARGPRFRADAEVVRDIALTASGLISYKMGGPGVIPPVPQNVLDYNYVYPTYWTAPTGPERYRRTVYGFRKRSMPDPVMSNFDAPNGDFSCARRVRSNTPLAALTGLNETIFVEAARALALRVLKEAGKDDAARAEHAFLLCTSRVPLPAERDEVLALLKSRRQRVADGWLNPREITTGDPAKLPDLPPETSPQDAAAWTLVARVLLNLDETITKN